MSSMTSEQIIQQHLTMLQMDVVSMCSMMDHLKARVGELEKVCSTVQKQVRDLKDNSVHNHKALEGILDLVSLVDLRQDLQSDLYHGLKSDLQTPVNNTQETGVKSTSTTQA